MSFILFIFACVTPSRRQESATENAKAYAKEMGLSVDGASCSASDSDQDGYLSCSLNSNGATKAIECNYEVAIAPLGQSHGCKSVVFVPIGVQP